MPERKLIPHARLKEWGPRLPILALILFSFYLMHENVYVGVPVLLLGVAAAIGVERLQRQLKCPDCGARTSPLNKKREPGAAIEFYCLKCHVTWDTGRRVPDRNDEIIRRD